MINVIKNYINRRQRIKVLAIDRKIDTVLLGNEYGGFLVCKEAVDVDKQIIVYSFGIGEDLSFSEGIFDTFNAKVYAFDPTPKAIKYVENHPLYNEEGFYFEPIGLLDKDCRVVFHLPQNDDYVSGSAVKHANVKEAGIEVEMNSLSTIVKRNGHNHIDILKMDIEGSEFEVLNKWEWGDTISIDQICVEVHDRFFNNNIDVLGNFVDMMRDRGYFLVAVFDKYEELTFINKRLLPIT